MFIGTRAFDLWATTSSCFRELWGRKFAGVSRRAPTMLDIWIGDSEVSAQWKLGVKHVECTPDGYETWEEYWASDEGKQAAAEMG